MNTPVAGQRLQISEVPSAVLGEAFSASEAENADSASSAATDAEAQQALEEATQNMQETFDELIALLDKESLLDGINCIDMENLQELIRVLRKAGAKSDATRGCGVHYG